MSFVPFFISKPTYRQFFQCPIQGENLSIRKEWSFFISDPAVGQVLCLAGKRLVVVLCFYQAAQ